MMNKRPIIRPSATKTCTPRMFRSLLLGFASPLDILHVLLDTERTIVPNVSSKAHFFWWNNGHWENVAECPLMTQAEKLQSRRRRDFSGSSLHLPPAVRNELFVALSNCRRNLPRDAVIHA